MAMRALEIFNKKTGALSALSAVLLLAVIMPSIPFASAEDDMLLKIKYRAVRSPLITVSSQ